MGGLASAGPRTSAGNCTNHTEDAVCSVAAVTAVSTATCPSGAPARAISGPIGVDVDCRLPPPPCRHSQYAKASLPNVRPLAVCPCLHKLRGGAIKSPRNFLLTRHFAGASRGRCWMAIAAASGECTLASRVEAAFAAAPLDEGPSAVARLLGIAVREAGASLDPVLDLVARYRHCGCFDRVSFVRAAVDGSEQYALHLHAAWRLNAADVLLFSTEYLASLDPLEAAVALEVQKQLLQLATSEPLAFQEVVCALVACTAEPLSDAAHSRVADVLLTDLYDWRLAQAAQHARPRLCAERFLVRLLDGVLRRSSPGDERLLDTVLEGLGVAAVPVICGAQHGLALARLLQLVSSALPLVEAATQQACTAALASRDATALSSVMQFMQAGLPPALYSDWFSRLADSAAQTSGGLPVLLNAVTVALPRDTPAALTCQAHAIAGLKRLPERSAEYVSHAKRRRAHLLSEHAQLGAAAEGGEAGAAGPTSAEGEVRELVAQYAALGGELPAAIKAAQSNFRRKWWVDTCAPALTTPQEVPPHCEAREQLIRVLEAMAPPLLPRGSGDAFAARVAALREGGPQAAAMLASCDALVAAISAGGLHTRMTAAARGCVATAATLAARADARDAATAELLVRATLKGWLDGCAASSPSSLSTSTAAWQAAFAAALRAWPPALTAALQTHLCETLRRSGDGVAAALPAAPATRRLSRDDAAVLLVHLAAIPIDAADATVAADTTATHGDLHAWLVEALCPVSLLTPDDVMASTRGSCAYVHAASRIMARWTLRDGGQVHAMRGGGSTSSRPAMAAVVPAEWLHRLMWLHSQLRKASTPGAAQCADALGTALGSAADWCAAAGGVPAAVASAMDAGRWLF